ncbi:MAG: MFS transporter [Actinomycetota bacterium]|nr:MFS transporter [Actinomycetota bacterium]
MTARAWALLLVLCGALFLEGVDIAMLNVAVPSIRSDLDLTTGTAHWVISAYVLGYGGFMLLGGRSADLFGRRRVFLVALAVFIAFSGLGGLADNGALLVLARFVTGVAAGFMTPAGLSIITTSFAEGPLRDRAVVIYGATGAGGFTLGMVAGGLLTSVSWRWVFFAPVILGSLLFVAGRVLIRPDQPHVRADHRFDLPGAVTVTAAMVAAIYGLVAFGEAHDVARGTTALGVAAALAIVFVLLEQRSPAPLVRLGILRSSLLVRTNMAGLLYMGGFFGFQFVVTLYLQDLRGWSPLETGLAFAIMGIDLILAPLLTPRLVRRWGNVPVMIAGFAAAALAFGLFLRIQDDWNYIDMLPMLILVGVAFALAYGPLTLAATEGVTEAEQGLAGGLLYTSFQFGAALGLALVTIVLVGDGSAAASLGDYRSALAVPTALAVAAALVAFRPRRLRSRQRMRTFTSL